jgi:hypothetical protein
MREFYPLIFSAIGIAILGLVEIALLLLLNRPWWHRRWIRNAAWMLPLFGILMVGLWGIGVVNSQDWLTGLAAYLTAFTFILEVALMVSLPLSGGMHLVGWLVGHIRKAHRRPDAPVVDSTRRDLLKIVTAGLPIATVGFGAAGFGLAMSSVVLPKIPITIPNLPPQFDGLRILHLSDIHLGGFIRLDDLELLLADATAQTPDMVLVTGDIADDLSLLADTLTMISDLQPRLGAFACLGNHEHYRGLQTVQRIFDNSTVPLLVDSAVIIEHEGARMQLAGVNDPRHMGASTQTFYRQAVAATLKEVPSEEFTLLMCHRPDGFDAAAEANVDLTLAGHTHGGQFGLRGRSVFEGLYPEKYLWGHYHRGDSHLYTSAGAGHWFPFRLGCPAEAPIILLSRG